MTDQEKVSHRESFKGHRTLQHYIDAVLKEEAEKDIKEAMKRREKDGSTTI